MKCWQRKPVKSAPQARALTRLVSPLSRPQALKRSLFSGTGLASLLFSNSAFAQEADGSITTFQMVQFSVLSGSILAAIVLTLILTRERSRTQNENVALRGKVSDMSSRLSQLEALTRIDGQRAIIWSDKTNPPLMYGSLDAKSGAPDGRSEFLAFGRWLEPASAAKIEHAIEGLRLNAVPFSLQAYTTQGVPLEVSGKTAGGSAVVRFLNLEGERGAHARLSAEHKQVLDTLETLQALLEKSPQPFWLRTNEERLAWCNGAYANAVDGKDADKVVEKSAELFGAQTRKQITEERLEHGSFSGQATTVVAGDRAIFDVIEQAGPFGSAGLAIDRSETEAVRTELNRTILSHEQTLNELTTAVAMFDEAACMQFHNEAFASLWDVDQPWLDSKPDMSMFLDRLRAEGKLPEQPEWRRWKQDILSAFQSVDPQEFWWHLPDRRTIRVYANPHPKGGVTWIFENMTEQIDLESRYKTMERVQGETLDNLAEGVAVFGPDGRLQLCNPAFGRFWHLAEDATHPQTHIRDIAAKCAQRGPGDVREFWDQIIGIVTGFDEDRETLNGRVLTGHVALSWLAVPLPNGQSMITFVDVTAADQIERALRERNDALEKTANLRNRFIRHVSHELRAPLTTIKGFTELLAMGTVGKLTQMQSEYVSHVAASSDALIRITDDILDLATVDAGIMELDFAACDVEALMREAADGLKDRFAEHAIDLVVRVAPDAGTIHADPQRMVRVFSNILSNAADFAPENSKVTFTCEHDADRLTFKLRDHGPGIDASAQDEIFERFSTASAGRSRGAGLGLAIVKSFVELHEGDVEINSSDKGTEVVIHVPRTPSQISAAAE